LVYDDSDGLERRRRINGGGFSEFLQWHFHSWLLVGHRSSPRLRGMTNANQGREVQQHHHPDLLGALLTFLAGNFANHWGHTHWKMLDPLAAAALCPIAIVYFRRTGRISPI